MSRKGQRLWTQAAAQARRLGSSLRNLLRVEIDDEAERDAAQLAEAEVVADGAAELRGGVVKAAQLRGYLQGGTVLSPEAQAVFGRLWDHVPGDEPQAIRRVIFEELGKTPEELFVEFDDRPLAAASLGQVHAGKLADGQAVAIKVQYPGVAEALRDDLSSRTLLRQIVGADLGNAISNDAIEALRERLLAELDYRAEAVSLQRFRRAFAREPAMVIPSLFAQLSSGRVLTMERLRGKSLTDFSASGSAAQRSFAAATILRFALMSVWRHHLINLDPNPGNYIVDTEFAESESGVRVGFVDFGCTCELNESIVEADRRLFLAMIQRDGEALRYAAHRSGLIEKATAFNATIYRSWEETLAAPFLSREPFTLDAAWSRQLTDLTWKLVQTGRMRLPPSALLLWRQRLGVFAVIASLSPRLPLRRLLAELLDDGENPIPLYDRYR